MDIVNLNDVKPFITKDTSEIREIISPANTSIKNQSIAEATVAVDMSTETHYHNKSEETYYIIEGKGEITIENEIRDVTIGDGIVILPGKRHSILNCGVIPLKFICFCTPAYSHEDTVLIY